MLSKEVGQDSPENVSQNVIKQNLCILIPNCVVKVRRTGRAREAQLSVQMLSFVGWQFVGTIIPLNIHNAETATIQYLLPTINHNTLSSGFQQYGKLPPCSSSAMKAVC